MLKKLKIYLLISALLTNTFTGLTAAHAQGAFMETSDLIATHHPAGDLHQGATCVSALRERGAQVNEPLDSLEVIIQGPGSFDPEAPELLPEEAADFTPRVYALRYASQETIYILKANGATLGMAPPERIRGWVLQGTTFDRATLEKRLESIAARNK